MSGILKVFLLAVVLLVTVVGVTSAAPDVIPVDSFTVATVNASPATSAFVSVTAQNVGSPGARGFDIWFNYDHANLSLDVVNSEVGSTMAGLGCAFGIGEIFDDGSQKLVSGFCTTAAGSTAQGANVELIRLKFDLIGTPGTYTISIPGNVLGQPSQSPAYRATWVRPHPTFLGSSRLVLQPQSSCLVSKHPLPVRQCLPGRCWPARLLWPPAALMPCCAARAKLLLSL
jgi:hypothetical protein